jgi:hypothetical protein
VLREQLPLLVAELEAVQEAFRTHNPAEPTRLLGISALVAPELVTAITATTALIGTLRQRADERTNALKTREDDLANLQARTTLQQFLPPIKTYVADAQWVDKARIQARRFPSILRTLTETAKAASEEALNKNFAQRFQDECKNLRAPNVALDFPGRQGQVTRRKTLTSTHRLNTVLSEGEQKVIGLADFLAEIGLKPPAPVVFDDPITSLDYRRLRDLVNRIADLSQERQVIVFSHNIWFTTELLSKFERNPDDCAYYDLIRTEQELGIITKGTHPRADTYNSLKGRLNATLQAAQPLTGEAQAALIEKGYEYLRSICEVIVETELLRGVTQRYQPNVMMTRLASIKADRLQAAITAILPIYEDCCRHIASHSQPLETLNIRPTLVEVKDDWKRVQDALAAYRNP